MDVRIPRSAQAHDRVRADVELGCRVCGAAGVWGRRGHDASTAGRGLEHGHRWDRHLVADAFGVDLVRLVDVLDAMDIGGHIVAGALLDGIINVHCMHR